MRHLVKSKFDYLGALDIRIANAEAGVQYRMLQVRGSTVHIIPVPEGVQSTTITVFARCRSFQKCRDSAWHFLSFLAEV